jgi:hypothetical protein
MTESSVLDLNALQVDIAKRMAASAGTGEWSEVRITMFAIGPRAQASLVRVTPTGDEESIGDSGMASVALKKMRHAMGKGPSGAWFTATATLTRTGEITFTYDYQTEPEWDIPPEPEDYLRDIAAYPRPADQIPEWHPAHDATEQ